MKTISAVIIFLLSAIAAMGQSARVSVPGTKVSMVPPEGFSLASGFRGFQLTDEIAIVVYELDGGNFESNTRNFSRARFEERGVSVLDFRKLEIDDFPAILAIIQEEPQTEGINLVFGDSTFSCMLVATYPAADSQLAAGILASILTTQYNASGEVDPFEGAFFSVDDSQTRLKFSKAGGGLYLFTVGGAEQGNDSSLIGMLLPLPADPSIGKKAILEKILEGLVSKGFQLEQILTDREIEINGYEGYELFLKGEIEGERLILLLVSVSNGQYQLVFEGIQKNVDQLDQKMVWELLNSISFNE